MLQGRQVPPPQWSSPCGVGGVGGWLAGNSSSVYTVNSAYSVSSVYGISSSPLWCGWDVFLWKGWALQRIRRMLYSVYSVHSIYTIYTIHTIYTEY